MVAPVAVGLAAVAAAAARAGPYLMAAGKIYKAGAGKSSRTLIDMLKKRSGVKVLKNPTKNQMDKAISISKTTMPSSFKYASRGKMAKKYIKKNVNKRPDAVDYIAGGALGGVGLEKGVQAVKKRNKSTKAKLEATKKKKYVKSPKSVSKNRGGTVRKSYNY